MTADNNSINRELGEATSRMDDHHRRLAELERISGTSRDDISKITAKLGAMDVRLKALEDTTKEIQTSVKKILDRTNTWEGFFNGVKFASGIWYVVIMAVSGALGAVITKMLS